MRFFLLFFSCLVVFPAFSYAGEGYGWDGYLFTPKRAHYERPYLQNARIPHNSRWAVDNWKPEDWAKQYDDPIDFMRGMYAARVIEDQYTKKGVPVLKIGPGFVKLSAHDKRRVLSLIDALYEITSSHENGVFRLVHWRKNAPVGVYTKYGLQLQ